MFRRNNFSNHGLLAYFAAGIISGTTNAYGLSTIISLRIIYGYLISAPFIERKKSACFISWGFGWCVGASINKSSLNTQPQEQQVQSFGSQRRH